MASEDSMIWSIFDKEEYLRNVHEHFVFDESVTDQEIIDFSEGYFDEHLGKYYVVAGNEFELRRIRREFVPAVEGFMYDNLSEGIISEPDRFFRMTERLFREGFYIEACIAARFTVERLFQYEVIHTPEYGERIRGNERNPGLTTLIKFLRKKDSWPDKFHWKVMRIKAYGDWQLHHRFDKMYEDMEPENFRWGVATATFGIGGMKAEFDPWLTNVQNRQKRARVLSFGSLKYLYEVMLRYREQGEAGSLDSDEAFQG